VTAPRRPLPVPDELSTPYWQATADHVLALARCSRCGVVSHPPDVVCSHCGSTEPGFVWTPVEGAGRVRSWTIMRQSFLPGFDDEVPFVLVDVELAEHPEVRLIGRLIEGVDAPLRLGAGVRVAFDDLGPGVAVPAFSLEQPV
jgi:uncharacterized OB-fold protein